MGLICGFLLCSHDVAIVKQEMLIRPIPKDETTPPVTKINRAMEVSYTTKKTLFKD